jgi:septal ring-binding cell division protein DamX
MAIGMLLLGAALRAPADGARSIHAEPERDRPPLDLAATAAADAERLSADLDAWTLQFLMACERENLEPFVDALKNQPNFFLLPYSEDGRDCYRVCWGRFPSKAEAERPRAYPDALRDVEAIRWARPVESVLP